MGGTDVASKKSINMIQAMENWLSLNLPVVHRNHGLALARESPIMKS